jgi:hypothetical protein
MPQESAVTVTGVPSVAVDPEIATDVLLVSTVICTEAVPPWIVVPASVANTWAGGGGLSHCTEKDVPSGLTNRVGVRAASFPVFGETLLILNLPRQHVFVRIRTDNHFPSARPEVVPAPRLDRS